jgi:hypothetical protein
MDPGRVPEGLREVRFSRFAALARILGGDSLRRQRKTVKDFSARKALALKDRIPCPPRGLRSGRDWPILECWATHERPRRFPETVLRLAKPAEK